MEDLTPEQRDKKLALIRNQVNLLMASFDTVHIFATKFEGENTSNFQCGDGNWFARYGHIKQWIIQEERPEEPK